MKKCKQYKSGSEELVYQLEDLEKLIPLFSVAEQLWRDEWKKQGARDYGSCYAQKGISVKFVEFRKRYFTNKRVVVSPPVQGESAVCDCVGPALRFLQENGVNCFYDCGWVD